MGPPDPIISLAIEPKTKADQEKLGTGLQKLMAKDSTFRVKTDTLTGGTIIRGIGRASGCRLEGVHQRRLAGPTGPFWPDSVDR